jgi:SAM-dependent methyltransferase
MKAGDTQFEKDWRRRFERYATVRDDDAGIAGWSEGGLAARYRHFARLWLSEYPSPAPASRWLDAGCGAGTYTRFLVARKMAVTAVDYSEPTTHKARERCDANVDWAVADATRLPIATGCLDGVLCFGVMQALSSPERALTELRRVLRPGGTLWVDALNADCLPTVVSEVRRRRQGRPQHLRYDHVPDFRAALRASGFDAVRTHWVPVMPERLRFLQPLMEGALGRTILRLPPLGKWASHSFLAVATASAQTSTS